MTGTPQGVSGDESRDGVGFAPSREVAHDHSGWGDELTLPPMFEETEGTPARVYTNGKGLISLVFGSFGRQYEMWTTENGAEALASEIMDVIAAGRKARET